VSGALSSAVERAFSIPGLPAPPGPFAWTTAWGGMLFVSGVRGIDPVTGALAATDEERLALIFAHLDRALHAGGSSLRHVLSTRVYVTDMARHRPLVNQAYERAFGNELPTRTIVEVSALNQADTIEVEVIAARTRGNVEGETHP
jgi:2-iminobutanoate/2-iminopropanoate deaminase